MAYTKEISRGTPEHIGIEDNKDKFRIPVTFVVKEDEVEVLSIDDYIEYTDGQNVNDCLKDSRGRIQAKLNAFKAEKALDDVPAVDSAIQTLCDNITL